MMKSTQLVALAIGLLATQSALSMDKSEAQAGWNGVNSALIKGIDGKPAHIFLLREKVTDSGTCYGDSGKEIDAGKCDTIFSDAKDLQSFQPIKPAFYFAECTTTNDEAQKSSCLTKFTKSKQKYVILKEKIESVSDLTKENLAPFLSVLRKNIDAQVAYIESREKGLDSKLADQKQSSKECQVYRMTVDLCRMTSVDESAKAASDHENEITKESGIVNKYSRYKIGQMKVFHGTKDIPAFKTKYKSLTGKDWSQSVCEVSEEQEKAAARGDYDPIQEEVNKCGCSNDPNSSKPCQ